MSRADRDYTDPKCWAHLLESEDGSERIAYSEESHKIRIPLIKSQMINRSSSTVFDIACGISYLDNDGDFGLYVGMDFCKESLAEGVNLSQSKNHLFRGDVRDPDFMVDYGHLPNPDYTVMCGLMMINGIFENYARALDFMMHCSLFTERAVIANFLWDKFIGQKEGFLRADSIDNIVLYLMRHNLGGRLIFGYLPHEFMVVLDPNQNNISVDSWI